MNSQKNTNDLSIRFEAQDIEWLLSAADLMIATGMIATCSKATIERIENFREFLGARSALPEHSGGYDDAFRFSDALASVKSCDSWEVRLSVDRDSYFKNVTFFIETFERGQRMEFKLTSNLQLGPGAEYDADPYEVYGVYANRLIELCQDAAPPNAKMLSERTVKVLVDWRAFHIDKKENTRNMAGLIATDIAASFAVRDAKIAWWTIHDDNTLSEHLKYADVVVSTSEEGHKNLEVFLEIYNEQVLRMAKPSANI